MKTIKFFQHKNLVLLAFIVFSVSACGGGGGGGGDTPNNNNTVSTVSIEISEVIEGSDNGTTPMEFTVRLDEVNPDDIEVDYEVEDISTEGTDDVVTTGGTLTIPAGATEATLPIEIVADTGFELNENFNVILSNPSSNAELGISQANGRIINDDILPITLAIIGIIPGNVNVDFPTLEFDILIDLDALLQDIDLENLFGDLAYDVYFDNGIVAPIQVSSGRLNISLPQSSPYSVRFQAPLPSGFDQLSLNGVFLIDFKILNLTGQPLPEVNTEVVQQPIEEQHVQDFTRLNVSDVSVFSDGAVGDRTPMTFTATLNQAIGSDVTVNYATVADSATADEDYASATGAVTIPAGETSATFDIEIIGDDEIEPNEGFWVDLTIDSSEVIMIQSRAGGHISDDDMAADFRTITVSNVQVTEGDSGTTDMLFDVTLDQPADTPVQFTYSTENDIGLFPADINDYQQTSGSNTFASGEQTKTVTVLINGDTDPENDESLLLRITSTTPNSVPFSVGRGTILSDDPLTEISITDVAHAEGAVGETTDFVFTVNLSVALGQDLVIDYNTVDGTATIADNDYTSATGSITIAQGDTSGTITVQVTGDNTPELDEIFNVVISTSSNAALISDDTGNGTILGDDSIGWSGEELVQASNNAVWPQLAFGPNGSRHVVYRESSTIENTVSSAPSIWSRPQAIGTSQPFASTPRVAIDDNGDGIAVWPDENDVVSSSILTAGTWVAATLPESVEAVRDINMASNPATGEAIIVWDEPANANNNNFVSIRSGHYDRVDGWQSINFVETLDGISFSPDIAMNDSGKTITVFVHETDVVAYEFNGSAWTGPTTLDDAANTEFASLPKIVMNDAGDVAVVWNQDDIVNSRPSVFLNYFDAGTGLWSGAMEVDTVSIHSAEKADVAIDAAGNVFVVWAQQSPSSDFNTKDMMARRYDPANASWSAAQALEQEDSDLISPILSQQVVADDEGNAIAVWTQDDGAQQNIRSARYSFADGVWQPANLLETSNRDAGLPQIVMDRVSGNAMVLWVNSIGRLWANRYIR